MSRTQHSRLDDHFGLDVLSNIGLVTTSPAQLTANTNDWNPAGLATADIIRLSTDASRDLTGIVAPSSSKLLWLMNVGTTNDLVIKHDATSTAANRFYCPGSVDLTLRKNASVLLLYDVTSSRWRVLGV